MTNDAAPTNAEIADAIIALAARWVGGEMESSARLCLDDAKKLRAAGDHYSAADRARDSLRYSVGILHHTYQRAAAIFDQAINPGDFDR